MAVQLTPMVAVMMRPLHSLAAGRNALFPWVPLTMGCAVAVWFSLAQEPGAISYAVAGGICLLAVLVLLRGPELAHPLAAAALCLALAWLACGLRLWSVAAPMLEFRYYGPVTGRVVEIDRSQTDAIRITLDQVWLDRVRPERRPDRVRVSLRGPLPGHVPRPGEVVMVTAHLAAPDGAVEPGAFDFRRMAFFARLGAVGYSTTPVMLWAPPETGARPIDRLRSHLSGAMMAAMPSQAGAFAAGAMTGDRSGITQETVQALRDSSLAHLLAISGMNLAFLIGFVFALIRYGVALIPWLALRVNSKKVAAVASLGVAAFYLALSGANVATERAFIMVSVMLGAVLLDRKALTLRSVAIAGVILLLWKPETMLEPGFQMSFAATIALIAGFREMDKFVLVGKLPAWVRPVFTLILSSLIGGLATAPYAAAHFNRFADYGLIANLLTVPVMGAVVMPAGAVAALLAPLGLAALPLWVMEKGAAWILMIAHWVAGWEGSVTAIPSPVPGVLTLITFAGAGLILWRGWWRGLAAGPMLAALVLWGWGGRPDVLISADGALVGVLGPEGRVLSAPKGAGFAARNWLENDGDLVAQALAAARPGMDGEEGARLFRVGALTGMALKGRGAVDRVAEACAQVDLVVIPAEVSARPDGCLLLDKTRLQDTGALALYLRKGGITIKATKDEARRWSAPQQHKALPQIAAVMDLAARQ
ncbi:ComEC/Rec2 family competence protein [Pseudotabrizicola sp. L79]|uniref:ComEC/Rec2 family competence protein n=1 Tax=Pseudotabrizicola sp. L79 TaxID=3118402 RepID=UPI002F9285AA